MNGAMHAVAEAMTPVELRSPSKQLPAYTSSPSTILPSERIFAFVPYSAPPLDGQPGAPAAPHPVGAANQALISKLFESLDALHAGGTAAGSSRDTSPSPIPCSGAGSAERAPSSPTEAAAFDLLNRSPSRTVSREHSADCLAAAMQQFSLGGPQASSQAAAAAAAPFHPDASPAAAGGAGALPWAHPGGGGDAAPFPGSQGYGVDGAYSQYAPAHQPTTPMQQAFLGAAGPHLPQQPLQPYYQQQYQQQYHNHQQQQLDYLHHGALPHQLPPPFVPGGGPGQDPLALAAAYHAMRMEHAAHQSRLLHPPPPVFDECLLITEDLNACATRLLSHIKTLQLADPPALGRLLGRRYFCSLKEVSKVVGGARLLLVAPDVRPSPTAHIKPVRLLQALLAAAAAAGVPVVFALSRRGIGQVFGRDKSMSIVAVMHVEGVEADYVALLEHAARGRQAFQALRAAPPAHTHPAMRRY